MCYNPNCGLILTAFTGAIEIFDPIELNVSQWDNKASFRKRKGG